MKNISMPFADERLKKICQKRMQELFGTEPAQEIQSRFSEELSSIRDHNASSLYVLGEMIAKKAKELDQPFLFVGRITSSLIAFLCGMTQANPLPENFGGLDIPFIMVTPYFSNNGSDLNIRTTAAFAMYVHPYLQAQFPEYAVFSPNICFKASEIDPEIKQFQIMITAKSDIEGIIKDNEKMINRHFLDGEELDHREMEIFNEAICINIDVTDQLSKHALLKHRYGDASDVTVTSAIPDIYGDYFRKNIKLDRIFSKTPADFGSLLDTIGLAIIRSSYMENGLSDEDCKVLIDHRIFFREDMYEYLADKDIPRDEAFIISESIRKGRHIPKNHLNIIDNYSLDKEIVNVIERIGYMAAKSQIADSTGYSLQMYYYKDIENKLNTDFYNKIATRDSLVDYSSHDLIVIGGRPAIGKSFLSMRLIRDALLQQDKKIIYFYLGGCNIEHSLRKALADIDTDRLIVKENDLEPDGIYDFCISQNNDNGIGLIVVDYIQLLFGDVEKDLQMLKKLSSDICASVVAISQINLGPEIRDDHVPGISDLSWRKTTIDMMDKIMFIYRDPYYNKDDTGRSAHLYVYNKGSDDCFNLPLVLDRDRGLFEDAQLYKAHKAP